MNPVTTTDEPSLFSSVNVPAFNVPPVSTPVNPEIETVPPVELNKSKVVVAE